MMAGSHVAVGLAAWVWAAPHLGLPPLDPAALLLATGGALLPDIDHPRSWVGRRCWLVSRPLTRLVGHRGFTHSLLAVAAGLFLLRHHGLNYGMNNGMTWARSTPLAVGYLSHLAADMLTPAGLRLAWPLRTTFSVPLCRTGSWLEYFLVAVLITAVAWPSFR